MPSPVILAKQNQALPDSFKMTINYVTGAKEEFDVAERGPLENGCLMFVTTDDVWHVLVIQNILRIEYDKNYSKIIAIREEEIKKNAIANAGS